MKSYKSDIFYPKRPILLHACATCFELPSNMGTMSVLMIENSDITYRTEYLHAIQKQIWQIFSFSNVLSSNSAKPCCNNLRTLMRRFLCDNEQPCRGYRR